MSAGRDTQGEKLTSLLWEDFEVGDRFTAPWGRTMTDAHVLAFSGVTGDFQHLHVDETYAAATEFGRRIIHGPLTAATGLGLQVYTQVWRNVVAFLEEHHTFKAPVYLGDTLFSVMTVTEARTTSRPDRGLVMFDNAITNQDDELACLARYTMMIRRR